MPVSSRYRRGADGLGMRRFPVLEAAGPEDLPERVRVYRNLNRRGPAGEPVYSVVDVATGRVVAHVMRIRLREVVFRVGLAGRARVRREKRKNVHAGLVGRPCATTGAVLPCRAWYDPYTVDTFVDRDDPSMPVLAACEALLDESGVSFRPC